jgi:hypothetical protein
VFLFDDFFFFLCSNVQFDLENHSSGMVVDAGVGC